MQNGWLHCFKVNHLFKLQIAITTCDTPPLTFELLNTLLAKTWSHSRSHYFTLLSATMLWKMTALYDLQLHLRYSCTKMFLNKVVNFKDFSRPFKEIKYFSKTLTKFKDFSRQILKIQDLFKIVRTMKGRARYPLTKSSTMTSKKWPS